MYSSRLSWLWTLRTWDLELSIDSIARDVIALLDELNIKAVTIVGHSMGGILASHLAATEPSRIKVVALLDGLEALADSIPSSATGSESTPLHHAFIRALILGTSHDGYIALCNVIANTTKPDYEFIKTPLLILAGEDDKTSLLAGCEGILKAYGEGNGDTGTGREAKRLVLLKGVGHWHCVEDAEGVGRHLKGFLESVR